jgi:ribosome-associated translation inhibitor RaiA
MKHIEQIDGIKTDIQTVGIEMNKYLHLRIQNLIKRLKNIVPDINWIDVYLKTTNNRLVHLRKVNIRVGIPGQDLIASDVGYTWRYILKSIEKKLKRQLEKRKAVVL